MKEGFTTHCYKCGVHLAPKEKDLFAIKDCVDGELGTFVCCKRCYEIAKFEGDPNRPLRKEELN